MGTFDLADKTILFCSPTHKQLNRMADFVATEARRQFNPLTVVLQELATIKDIDPATKAMVISEATKLKANGGITMDYFLQVASQPGPLAFILWILGSQDTPGLTMEWCRQNVTKENAIEVMMAIEENCGEVLRKLGNKSK